MIRQRKRKKIKWIVWLALIMTMVLCIVLYHKENINWSQIKEKELWRVYQTMNAAWQTEIAQFRYTKEEIEQEEQENKIKILITKQGIQIEKRKSGVEDIQEIQFLIDTKG